jgi:hypothetical protein
LHCARLRRILGKRKMRSGFVIVRCEQLDLLVECRFVDLGGRLKTGHRWTVQNRPTERNQSKSIYTLRKGAWANTVFGKAILASLYWSHLGRRQRRDAQHSGGKAINPRGLGTESPSKREHFLVFSAAVNLNRECYRGPERVWT